MATTPKHTKPYLEEFNARGRLIRTAAGVQVGMIIRTPKGWNVTFGSDRPTHFTDWDKARRFALDAAAKL